LLYVVVLFGGQLNLFCIFVFIFQVIRGSGLENLN
jgi:hypothetical protein